MENDDVSPPEDKRSSDDAKALGLAVVSMVPAVGPIAAAVIDRVFPEEMQRRRQDWERRVAAAIEKLQERSEDYVTEEEFATILVQTTEQARRNHQSEKLDALEAAVKNADMDVDYAIKQQLIRYFDELSVLHLQFLSRAAAGHRADIQSSSGPRAATLIADFARTHFEGETDIVQQVIINELDAQKQLIVYTVPGGVPRTKIELTWLGEKFCELFEL